MFKLLETVARGKKREAIEGIIAEAKSHMDEIEDNEVLDQGVIAVTQAIEHYETTRYGSLIAWAKQLGHTEAVSLLEQNLEQEKHADMLLSDIALSSANARTPA